MKGNTMGTKSRPLLTGPALRDLQESKAEREALRAHYGHDLLDLDWTPADRLLARQRSEACEGKRPESDDFRR